jgi:ribosomal protein L7/L12
VRELTGFGLKESKDLVEKPLPQVIKDGLTRQQAEQGCQLFGGHADVVIEPDHGMRTGRQSGEPCASPDSFRLMLRSYPPQNKLWAIKYVRELTGLGLKEAKDLVEKPLPQVIVEGLTREQVERARQSFAGYADVSIESY